MSDTLLETTPPLEDSINPEILDIRERFDSIVSELEDMSPESVSELEAVSFQKHTGTEDKPKENGRLG